MTVTVDRLKLISSIKAKRAETIAAHDKAKAEYDDLVLAYKSDCVKKLKSAMIKVQSAKSAKTIESALTGGYGNYWPHSPHEPQLDVSKYDDALKKLALVVGDVIQLKDRDRYLEYI